MIRLTYRERVAITAALIAGSGYGWWGCDRWWKSKPKPTTTHVTIANCSLSMMPDSDVPLINIGNTRDSA